MYALGWIFIIVAVVFGVMGGVANVLLAENYIEFWTLSVPLTIVGFGLGKYCLTHGRRERARG